MGIVELLIPTIADLLSYSI